MASNPGQRPLFLPKAEEPKPLFLPSQAAEKQPLFLPQQEEDWTVPDSLAPALETRKAGELPKSQLMRIQPSPAQRRAARQTTRSLRRAEAIAKTPRMVEAGVKVPEPPDYRGLFATLHQLDRLHNFVTSGVMQIAHGEKDPLKIAEHAIKGLALKEDIWATDIADSFGIRGQLFLATLGNQMVKGPLAGGGGPSPKEWPLYLRMGALGLDTLADPMTWIPGKWITAPLKAGALGFAKVSPKGAATLKGLARSTVMRSTGMPALDKLLGERVDLKYLIEHDFGNRFSAFLKSVRPLTKQHKEMLTKLAEESDLPRTLDFIQSHWTGQIDRDTANTILNAPERFRNPSAVREAMAIDNPVLQDLTVSGAQRFRRLLDITSRAQEAAGKTIGSLGSQIDNAITDTEKAFTRTLNEEFQASLKESQDAYKAQMAVVESKSKMLSETIGPKRMREITKKLAEDFRLSLPSMPGNQASLMARAVRRSLEHHAPDFLRGFENIQGDRTAAQKILKEAQAVASARVSTSPQLKDLGERLMILHNAYGRVPAWVPHVASEVGAEALETEGKARSIGSRIYRTPRTEADIPRKFRKDVLEDVSRELSIDEVEEAVRSGGYGLTRGEAGLYKNYTPLRKFIGKPVRELAQFLDADEHLVAATAIRQTAKGVSNTRFLRDAAAAYGKPLEALNAQQAKFWKPMSELAPGIAQAVPSIRNLHFDPREAKEILYAYESWVKPQKVLAIYDKALNVWKAHTLFLFPWYFTRNVWGNVTGMMLSGFGEDPRDFFDLAKATYAQMRIGRGDVKAATEVSQYVKSLGTNVDMYRLHREALKRGVFTTGWYGGDLPRELLEHGDPWYSRPGMWIPGSTKSAPLRAGRAVGTFLENNARWTVFANQLRKGKNFDEAAAAAKKFLGDYRTELMNPFEREVAGRFMPFYRWLRYNLPLQVEQLLLSRKNRSKILFTARTAREVAKELGYDVAKPPEYVPDWIVDGLGVPVRYDKQTGELELLMAGNWHPAGDLARLSSARAFLRLGLGDLTPAFKIPIELALGRRLWGDTELQGQEQEFLGKQRDAEWINLIGNIRLVREWDRMDPLSHWNWTRTHNLRPQVTNRERIAKTAGVSLVKVSPERLKSQYENERLRMIQSRINRARKAWRIQAQEKRESTTSEGED